MAGVKIAELTRERDAAHVALAGILDVIDGVRTERDAALAEIRALVYYHAPSITRAVEAEREACAKVCEGVGDWRNCQAEIRARGKL